MADHDIAKMIRLALRVVFTHRKREHVRRSCVFQVRDIQRADLRVIDDKNIDGNFLRAKCVRALFLWRDAPGMVEGCCQRLLAGRRRRAGTSRDGDLKGTAAAGWLLHSDSSNASSSLTWPPWASTQSA